jgi:DNA-binding NtrC family response regulator
MHRVLVVDDQSHVRSAILAALDAKGGFSTSAAENGADGLKLFRASKFDLLIADLYMPGMDGVKLIKEMRAIDPSLAVVAISGVLLRTTGRSALDLLSMNRDLAGIATLQKPFRPTQLMQAIRKAFDLAAVQQAADRGAVTSPAEQAPTDR